MLTHDMTAALDGYWGKKILITGSRGYLGSAMAATLAGIDCKLVLLDHVRTERWLPSSVHAEIVPVVGSVVERATWDLALKDVDVVFHFAAHEVHGEQYEWLPDFKVNTQSMMHLLESCRANDRKAVILNSSTANIFGLADRVTLNEDCPHNPPSPWSLHKLHAEQYLQFYAQQYGIHGASLRLANVYGPTARRESRLRVVINKVAEWALKTGEMTLFKNRACIRDFVYIDDVLRAFLLAGTGGKACEGGRFFVLGSGEGKTLEQIWEILAAEVGRVRGKPVVTKVDSSLELRVMEMRSFTADTRRFKEATGWEAMTDLEQGIVNTVQSLI